MPRGKVHHAKQGQAMAELVIALVVIVILIVGTTTLAQLALAQIRLRRDVRAEAGQAGIKRATAGWLESEDDPKNGQPQFNSIANRINEYTKLNSFSPELDSRLPASNYTLQARALPTGELGLETTQKTKVYPLDPVFTTLIYSSDNLGVDENGNVGIRLKSKLTYPATNGLWPEADTR